MLQRFATRSAVSPIEISHSAGSFELGKRQPSVVSATAGAPRAKAVSGLSVTHGARVMLSTPPARKQLPSPDLIACAALAIAWRPEPQRRLTVWPGTVIGRPASRRARRATFLLSSPD